MWSLLEDISLFDRPAGEDGKYDAHVHLAQMVTLLGDPLAEIIEREKRFRSHELEEPVFNQRGKQCKTMNEFWGGPFFDDDTSKTDIRISKLHPVYEVPKLTYYCSRASRPQGPRWAGEEVGGYRDSTGGA